MEFKDYYQTLGVARDASGDDIKAAYRKLARKFHPDVSKEKDAEARFKEIGEAGEVLRDPEKRAAYDSAGSQWARQQAAGGTPRGAGAQDFQPPPGWNAGFEFSGRGDDDGLGGADHSDFFEALFGRRARAAGSGHARANAQGGDHHAKIEIDLADAYHGAQRTITLLAPVMDARGSVVTHERRLDVTVPKGVREGQHLRLSGQGAPGLGAGPAGDLYLEIAFRPDPRFRVDGRDVHMSLLLAPWEAALGTSVSASTPDGPVQLTIPPNSVAGRRLRLKGKGIPGKAPGDLYAELSIVVPRADTDAAREAYRAFEKAFDFNPRADAGGGK